MMPVVSSNELGAWIILVIVFIDFSCLDIELFSVGEVNAFDPLESLSDTILHVELSNVDQNLEALGDERCV